MSSFHRFKPTTTLVKLQSGTGTPRFTIKPCRSSSSNNNNNKHSNKRCNRKRHKISPLNNKFNFNPNTNPTNPNLKPTRTRTRNRNLVPNPEGKGADQW